MKMTQEQFEKKCYDAYQLDWMISHGHSLDEYRHLLASIAGMTFEENPLDIPSNENDMETLIAEAEDTFQDTGFASGCLFACMDEFLSAEYLDPDYMDHLLSDMFDSKNCKTLWEEFTGLKLPNQITMEPGKSYILPIKEGHLDTTVSLDPTYPGIDIEYIPNKEDELKNDELWTRPRVLIENKEDTLRAVIWGDPHKEDYTEAVNFTCIDDVIK